jgi:hypothetical protein
MVTGNSLFATPRAGRSIANARPGAAGVVAAAQETSR